jgi:two-component system CheB/CheR fusion protein
LEWLGTSTDIEDTKILQTQQKNLVAELQVRSGNLISEVQKLADTTLQDSNSLDDFGRLFFERLNTLAQEG